MGTYWKDENGDDESFWEHEVRQIVRIDLVHFQEAGTAGPYRGSRYRGRCPHGSIGLSLDLAF